MSHISPGPYRSFRELSLAGSVDPDIWCPPTFVGNSGIECFNGVRGFALLFLLLATLSYPRTSRHTPRRRGYPVRRGVSAESLKSLEYWITRLAGDDSGKTPHDGNPVERRLPHRNTRKARCVERRAARGCRAGDGKAWRAVCDRTRH